ncbi:MAG: hypothetical protein A2162_08540 [Deltaproteobacteria bacterium RBG_13_52_11b]|nr:MAG: hypothetical protein A2162_08540 [Deltaproteobacteria bacterium RBG_13_52_11b]
MGKLFPCLMNEQIFLKRIPSPRQERVLAAIWIPMILTPLCVFIEKVAGGVIRQCRSPRVEICALTATSASPVST